MKKKILQGVFFAVALSANAQQTSFPTPKNEHNIFNHLDLSLTAGTTGIGLDLASPLGDYLQLRAGYSIMPRFEYRTTFEVQVGQDASSSKAKFSRLQGLLEGVTGKKVDEKVDMIGKPTYHNFKFLIDVFPFKNNKHWHFTAGFFWGPSKIATAYNPTEEMSSLLAVSIYNNLYEKAINRQPFVTFQMDGQSYVWTDDPEFLDVLEEKFTQLGRMGVRIGDYKDGTPYIIEPDENSMVKADVRVNAFKPYIGFGYGGRLIKGNDKYKVSFDVGAMFWGGTPSVIAHDGVDFAKDIENIPGKVGSYVRLVKAVKVFPVLEFRLTRTLF